MRGAEDETQFSSMGSFSHPSPSPQLQQSPSAALAAEQLTSAQPSPSPQPNPHITVGATLQGQSSAARPAVAGSPDPALSLPPSPAKPFSPSPSPLPSPGGGLAATHVSTPIVGGLGALAEKPLEDFGSDLGLHGAHDPDVDDGLEFSSMAMGSAADAHATAFSAASSTSSKEVGTANPATLARSYAALTPSHRPHRPARGDSGKLRLSTRELAVPARVPQALDACREGGQ